MKSQPDPHNERGVILIALLWILVALSVVALSFSREGFVEVAAARNARDLTRSYYVARAGIAATVYELWKKRTRPPVRGIELAEEPNPIDLGKLSGRLGDGYYDVEIQDESGKINLNFVQEEHLRSLLAVLEIPKPEADIITDSIQDWRDLDNLHRINGAEDDYYQSLETPYKAKNGQFDTVEELLQVRGITADYFYGHEEAGPDGAPRYRYGLSRYLTVYSPPSGRVNINHAPLVVLLSIPGMPPEAAQFIYERRLAKPVRDLGGIMKELPVQLGANVMPLLSTGETGFYMLTSFGRLENSKVRRVVRTVISLDMRDASRYMILYWNENVPNL